jgi:hypothetical protein
MTHVVLHAELRATQAESVLHAAIHVFIQTHLSTVFEVQTPQASHLTAVGFFVGERGDEFTLWSLGVANRFISLLEYLVSILGINFLISIGDEASLEAPEGIEVDRVDAIGDATLGESTVGGLKLAPELTEFHFEISSNRLLGFANGG